MGKRIWNNMKRIIHIWWFEFRMIVCSSRWLVLSIITFFLVKFYLIDVFTFADAYGLKDYPAAFAFLFTDYTFVSLGMLILIFMMSVFPVKNRLQQNILFRSGNFSWITGQFLAMATIAVVWILEIQLFICLVFGKRMDFSGWGKLWKTIETGKYLEYGFSMNISVSNGVIEAYEPWQAILFSMILVWLMAVLFGEFIFCIDGICKNYIGEIILALWSFMWILVGNFHMMEKWEFIKKITPKKWIDISRYVESDDLLRESLGMMIFLMIVLYILSLFFAKKKIITPE